MSAAVKLRALERQQRDLRFHRETADEARRDVLAALPQIVELVEAAETCAGEIRETGHTVGTGLIPALTALEGAL